MIYSRRALLALFAVLALSTSVAVLAAPPDAPEPPLSPARARRAEREAEKEAASTAAPAPAPAPAKSKKAKAANSTALPAKGKANTHYYVNARSALYTPAPKGSDKPGTLKLEGVVPTVLGAVKSSDGLESNIDRVTAAQLFGGPKAKQRLPVFDKKEGGMDAVLLGTFLIFLFSWAFFFPERRGTEKSSIPPPPFLLSLQNTTTLQSNYRRPRQERHIALPRPLQPPRLQGGQGLVGRVRRRASRRPRRRPTTPMSSL